MDKRQKKAWSLFVTYLMVVLFSNGSGNSFYDSDNQKPKHLHSHDIHEGGHHEHSFHIGIFHYLEHIYESIVSSDFDTDDHFTLAPKVGADEKTMSLDIDDYNNQWTNLTVISYVHVLANPPPVDWSIPINLQSPHLPLRAPPTVA